MTVSTEDAENLTRRLEALAEAASLAEGRLDESDVASARSVLARAGRRSELGLGFTVAALAGATGSGKSSLFNSLAGETLASVGVRRPTTGRVEACVWGPGDPSGLLDWVGAARRHRHAPEPALEGLVLLDLPDHDSVEASHRVQVDRLVELVDLLVWVVDPQKYADAALHDGYLRPLHTHREVVLVVLNRIDELDRDARRACLVDLRRLVDADGLAGIPLLATSARTGEGVEDLRAELARRVEARRSALLRLAADIGEAAARLAASCEGRSKIRRFPDRSDREELVASLADAAGVEGVADAVARAHRHRAALATGWPLTRWVRRLRPDPLRRLHLDRGEGDSPTSLPPPGPVQRARIDTALRAVAGSAGSRLPEPWPEVVRDVVRRGERSLPDDLDRAVARADLGMQRPPRWWSVVAGAQRLLVAIAGAGLLWLAVLFVVGWLRLPDPPTPELGRVPLPTGLLLGGLLLGLLLAAVARLTARAGGERRRRAARRHLVSEVERVADRSVLEPVAAELAARDAICEAARRASERRPTP